MGILSVRGTLPDHRYPQQAITDAFAAMIATNGGLDERLLRRVHANVGYGELLPRGRGDGSPPSRRLLLEQLEELLPGMASTGTDWRGHHLPLSSWRREQPDGRVLRVGDAAGLVNPMTGEGIYYAVATGILAGRTAADTLNTRGRADAGRVHAC